MICLISIVFVSMGGMFGVRLSFSVMLWCWVLWCSRLMVVLMILLRL